MWEKTKKQNKLPSSNNPFWFNQELMQKFVMPWYSNEPQWEPFSVIKKKKQETTASLFLQLSSVFMIPQ